MPSILLVSADLNTLTIKPHQLLEATIIKDIYPI